MTRKIKKYSFFLIKPLLIGFSGLLFFVVYSLIWKNVILGNSTIKESSLSDSPNADLNISNPTLAPTITFTPIPTIVSTMQPLPVLSNDNIFNAVNRFRVANGRAALSISGELCSIAESRADFMMEDNMAGFKGSKVGSHVGFRDLYYSGAEIGENLAANVGSTSETMSTWENSPPHRALMLSDVLQGVTITKGCIANRVSKVGSVVVLEVGDK